MESSYDHKRIEPKWQKYWADQKLYETPRGTSSENKMYILPQLPYPSGSGLHVGHAEVYTACDIYARYQRMIGKKVLQVIGWDSFGLPAENYAIKTNVHPRESTEKAIDNFRSQIKALGISVDWDREVGSHNPDYYKWTQWFFLLMYKRGLAYRKKQSVNWCDSCKTVLANEQVTPEGNCERCETMVVQRQMEQWYLKITDYADRLLEGLDRIDWPDETKKRQRDWIGRSEGAEINFGVRAGAPSYLIIEKSLPVGRVNDLETFGSITVEKESKNWGRFFRVTVTREREQTLIDFLKKHLLTSSGDGGAWYADSMSTSNRIVFPGRVFDIVNQHRLEEMQEYGRSVGIPENQLEHMLPPGLNVFTTRPDTIFGATYMVLAPEHGLIDTLKDKIGNWEEVQAYVVKTKNKTDLDRQIEQEKIGVELKGLRAVNPLNGEEIPIWIADYVLSSYGTGAIMAVPAHDERDWEFAKKYGLEIRPVILLIGGSTSPGSNSVDIKKEEINKILEKGAHTGDGKYINSDFLVTEVGYGIKKGIQAAIREIEKRKVGISKIQYKLRDWSISRQRFWGAPIPMIYSEERKNKKRNYILIHGYGGSGDSNFFPKLKSDLEALGHHVFCPNLPDTDSPKVDCQIEYILEHTKLDEDTVLLGHSLGGAVAMKLLERTKQRVAKVIFVDAFCKSDFEDTRREPAEQSCDWQFDFETIKSLANEFVMLADDRYQTISKEHAEYMRSIFDARLIVTHPKEWHFCAEFEPDVLEHAGVDGFLSLSLNDLPVKLPDDVDFKPTGQSPLTYSDDFQKGIEEKYGKAWRREVDTLDTFMCSSWYYFRYLDPRNDEAFASPEQLKKWMPVDFYLGGAEHVNGHLLYSRFFTKVLYDAGYIDFDEPFLKHRHQGLILGEDNRKMSKRWNNVINPTDVVNEFGADTCRMYEMFMGPLEDSKPWNTNGVKGIKRFLERLWRLQDKVKKQDSTSPLHETEVLLHKTIKKVGEDLSLLQFNTAIAKLMELSNEFQRIEFIPTQYFETFVKLLSPFAPFIAEELWQGLGHRQSIALESWPDYDESKLFEDKITLVVQVNGKVRANIEVEQDITEEDAKEKALQDSNVQKWLEGREAKKIIYVKKKLISIVV